MSPILERIGLGEEKVRLPATLARVVADEGLRHAFARTRIAASRAAAVRPRGGRRRTHDDRLLHRRSRELDDAIRVAADQVRLRHAHLSGAVLVGLVDAPLRFELGGRGRRRVGRARDRRVHEREDEKQGDDRRSQAEPGIDDETARFVGLAASVAHDPGEDEDHRDDGQEVTHPLPEGQRVERGPVGRPDGRPRGSQDEDPTHDRPEDDSDERVVRRLGEVEGRRHDEQEAAQDRELRRVERERSHDMHEAERTGEEQVREPLEHPSELGGRAEDLGLVRGGEPGNRCHEPCARDADGRLREEDERGRSELGDQGEEHLEREPRPRHGQDADEDAVDPGEERGTRDRADEVGVADAEERRDAEEREQGRHRIGRVTERSDEARETRFALQRPSDVDAVGSAVRRLDRPSHGDEGDERREGHEREEDDRRDADRRTQEPGARDLEDEASGRGSDRDVEPALELRRHRVAVHALQELDAVDPARLEPAQGRDGERSGTGVDERAQHHRSDDEREHPVTQDRGGRRDDDAEHLLHDVLPGHGLGRSGSRCRGGSCRRGRRVGVGGRIAARGYGVCHLNVSLALVAQHLLEPGPLRPLRLTIGGGVSGVGNGGRRGRVTSGRRWNGRHGGTPLNRSGSLRETDQVGDLVDPLERGLEALLEALVCSAEGGLDLCLVLLLGEIDGLLQEPIERFLAEVVVELKRVLRELLEEARTGFDHEDHLVHQRLRFTQLGHDLHEVCPAGVPRQHLVEGGVGGLGGRDDHDGRSRRGGAGHRGSGDSLGGSPAQAGELGIDAALFLGAHEIAVATPELAVQALDHAFEEGLDIGSPAHHSDGGLEADHDTRDGCRRTKAHLPELDREQVHEATSGRPTEVGAERLDGLAYEPSEVGFVDQPTLVGTGGAIFARAAVAAVFVSVASAVAAGVVLIDHGLFSSEMRK